MFSAQLLAVQLSPLLFTALFALLLLIASSLAMVAWKYLQQSLAQASTETSEALHLAESAQLDSERDRNALSQIQIRLAASEAGAMGKDEMLAMFKGISAEAAKTQAERVEEQGRIRFEQLEKDAETQRGQQAQVLHRDMTAFSAKLERLEKGRVADAASVTEVVKNLGEAQLELRDQTGNLASALKNNQARGAWGEAQLRRVFELAGMTKHVDFVEQVSIQSDGESHGRPDAIVTLANDQVVIIDAKAPLGEYLEASGCEDPDERKRLLKSYVAAVKARVKELSKRDYNSYGAAFDYVIMYLPGESFLSVAYEQEPDLLELAVSQGVLLATPTNLMALLQTIRLGWNERRIAEDSREIARLGKELHKRAGKFTEHLAKVGTAINSAADAYNKTVGSMEKRLMPTAEQLGEMAGVQNVELPPVKTVDKVVRATGVPVATQPELGTFSDRSA